MSWLLIVKGSCDCTDHWASISTGSKSLQRGLISHQGVVPGQVSTGATDTSAK